MTLGNCFPDFSLVFGRQLIITIKKRIVITIPDDFVQAGNLPWRDAAPSLQVSKILRILKGRQSSPVLPIPGLELFCFDPGTKAKLAF
jgi:hypothetical protein